MSKCLDTLKKELAAIAPHAHLDGIVAAMEKAERSAVAKTAKQKATQAAITSELAALDALERKILAEGRQELAANTPKPEAKPELTAEERRDNQIKAWYAADPSAIQPLLASALPLAAKVTTTDGDKTVSEYKLSEDGAKPREGEFFEGKAQVKFLKFVIEHYDGDMAPVRALLGAGQAVEKNQDADSIPQPGEKVSGGISSTLEQAHAALPKLENSHGIGISRGKYAEVERELEMAGDTYLPLDPASLDKPTLRLLAKLEKAFPGERQSRTTGGYGLERILSINPKNHQAIVIDTDGNPKLFAAGAFGSSWNYLGNVVQPTAKPIAPEQRFADDALRQRGRDVADLRKKMAKYPENSEVAQRYQGMIDDYLSVDADAFTQDVKDNYEYYANSNVDPFLRFKNREVNRAEALKPLDHGELNIPGRTDTINAELDKHKAEADKAQKTQSKADIADSKRFNANIKAILEDKAFIAKKAKAMNKTEAEIKAAIREMGYAAGSVFIEAYQKEKANEPYAGKSILKTHRDFMERVVDGGVTAEDFIATFDKMLSDKDAITAELGGMTKDAIFKEFSHLKYRYKNEVKADLVDAAYRDILGAYNLEGTLSWGFGSGSFESALTTKVRNTTDETLKKHSEAVKKIRAERETLQKEVEQGMADPQTLDDYTRLLRSWLPDVETFKDAYMKLTPEQRETYDRLYGEHTRGERKAKADQQKTQVNAAVTSTSGDIIETKHTKTGQDLFVVKAAERVERDVYNEWNMTAKRLGGWYSAYRAGGAVPGFQFKTRENAEAFLKYLGGDVTEAKEAVQARRDAYADDKSQSAVERLTEMADKLEGQADEELGRSRKENTARRARQAASAIASAERQKALAKTMRNIAQAIESGKAKFLDRVRQKTQVEYLLGLVNSTHRDQIRATYAGNYADYLKHEHDPITKATADHVAMPTYTLYRSDLAALGRQLLETDGFKKYGQQIMKVADDVTDAYLKFAKDNLHKVSLRKVEEIGGGKILAFSAKRLAESALERSNYNGKAIILPITKKEYAIVLSPAEAMKLGIWQGDNDKKITLNSDFARELVEKLGRANRKKEKVKTPWQFENAFDNRKRLAGMGLENNSELRNAIRELIGLQETPKAPDKVKEMERAMIGRKNDGLDFFPTPASVADTMVEAAGLEDGMSILEPSAGMGHIAERIREAGFEPDVAELSGDRRELLEVKGFNVVGSDFMGLQPESATDLYDRIIMNPPFSDRRDMAHVQHAYNLLKPGGRLVAIMGEGVFFGNDKKAQAFRAWLDEVGGTDEKLEEGTFKDPSLPVNTGANARMVVIEKSADAKSGGTEMYSIADTSAGAPLKFYSQLSRAIDNLPPKVDNTSGNAVKVWLQANAAKLGVKQDELNWSGVLDWLGLQGKAKVSKADIQAYLKAGGVRVEETVLGGGEALKKGDKVSYSDHALEQNPTRNPNTIGIVTEVRPISDDGIQYYYVNWPDIGETLAHGDNIRLSNLQATKTSQPRYANYRTPGGKEGSYRELLLTLPAGDQSKRKKLDSINDRYQQIVDASQGRDYTKEEQAEIDRLTAEHDKIADTPISDYKSSHWDQPNVLAHIRFDERTDADGNKVLFINELQSDWGQEGKKKGFAKQYKKGDLEVIKQVIDKENPGNYAYIVVEKGTTKDIGLGQFFYESVAEIKMDEVYSNPLAAKPSSLMPAPFVTNTKDWVSLALKRMVLYAAENGFDRVAFATGEQNADLYNLRKHLSVIAYEELDDQPGKYEVYALDLQGKSVFSEDEIGLDRIERVFGKEIAQRVEAGQGDETGGAYRNWKELKGDNLEITAHGMNAFYDQIVPQVANDVLRKVGGGKVEQVKFGDDRRSYDETQALLNDYDAYPVGSPQRKELLDYLDEAPDYGHDSIRSTQPGFTITHAMLDFIAKNGGLPLFSKEQGKAASKSTIAQVKAFLTPRQLKLVESGKIKVVQSHPRAGAQAFYKGGVLTLVADNLTTQEIVEQVVAHESWHYARDNDPKVQARLEQIDRQFEAIFNEAAQGNGTAAELAAHRRVVNAKVAEAHRLEEFQAYLIEAYRANPKTLSEKVRKAIQNLIALVRATLMRYAGVNFSTYSVADLAAIAESSPKMKQGSPHFSFGAENEISALNKAGLYSEALEDMPDYKRQYDEIERKYWDKDGNPKPGAMLAPNGEQSKLNKTQWIQVRTQAFKRWAGNWNYDGNQVVDIVEAKELPSHVNYKNAASVRKWLLSNEKFKKPVENTDAGIFINFTADNLRASLKRRGKEQRQAYTVLRDLLSTAKYFETEKSDRDSLAGQDVYYAAMKLNDALYAVKIKADILHDTKTVYKDHKPIAIENVADIEIAPAVFQGGREALEYPSEDGPARSGLGVKLSLLTNNVKPEATKVLDENGEPRVVWHGTTSSFNEFKHGKASGSGDGDLYFGKGFYFTNDKENADSYSNYEEEGTMAVFLNIKSPFISTDPSHSSPWSGKSFMKGLGLSKNDEIQPYLIKQGHDGIIHESGEPNYGRSGLSDIDYNEYVIFNPNQIKSATGNTGAFSREDDDIRYSIAPKAMQEGIAHAIQDRLKSAKTFNWLNKSINTQAYKAFKDPVHFKPVFNTAIAFEQETAKLADHAASHAPTLLPKLENISKSLKEFTQAKKRVRDAERIGQAIFDTTLRDKPMTDAELAGYTPPQRKIYREFFAAVNQSLDDLVLSEMARAAKAENMALYAGNDIHAAANHYAEQADDPELGKSFIDKAQKIQDLKDKGYAPLQRFGQYTVTVKIPGQKTTEYFGMYESEKEANADFRALQAEYPDAEVVQGIMSQDDWQMFKGVTPETMGVFAKLMGIDGDQAFQAYLQQAVNNRSALKRLIHRRKVEGYSIDPQRVLATFITSNARLASKNWHLGEMLDKIAAIPKVKGDVKDEAVALYNYVQNPGAEGAAVRNLMFTWYLGGSVAAAAVNLTQSFTTTYPALHQLGSAAQVAKALPRAMKLALNTQGIVGELGRALKRAEAEGVTAPHELHGLYAASGGALLPQVSRYLRPLGKLWGSLFGLAESYNRRVAFIAAFEMAQGSFYEKFERAEQLVNDTQFIYSKSSRSNWARGTAGSALFTFKTFTINYLEFLSKLPMKERAIALGVLLLFAGASGAPGADDLDDLIDTVGQSLGYNTNAKGWKERHLNTFLLYGISSVLPIDLSSRLGVGNVIPGSALFKRSETDKARDVLEFVGPVGGFAKSVTEAFDVATGQPGLGGKVAAFKHAALPKALADFTKAVDIAETGMYRDYTGKKVVEATLGDAWAKGLGFQPSRVAEARRPERAFKQLKDLAVRTESEIADLWADGIAEKDKDKVDDARELLRDWNRKNPETPIKVNFRQVLQRLKAMRMTSKERLLKMSPKEIRGYGAGYMQ